MIIYENFGDLESGKKLNLDKFDEIINKVFEENHDLIDNNLSQTLLKLWDKMVGVSNKKIEINKMNIEVDEKMYKKSFADKKPIEFADIKQEGHLNLITIKNYTSYFNKEPHINKIDMYGNLNVFCADFLFDSKFMVPSAVFELNFKKTKNEIINVEENIGIDSKLILKKINDKKGDTLLKLENLKGKVDIDDNKFVFSGISFNNFDSDREVTLVMYKPCFIVVKDSNVKIKLIYKNPFLTQMIEQEQPKLECPKVVCPNVVCPNVECPTVICPKIPTDYSSVYFGVISVLSILLFIFVFLYFTKRKSN